MKKIIEDTLIVYGMMFVVLLILSLFTDISTLTHFATVYLILLFIIVILGKYILSKIRQR